MRCVTACQSVRRGGVPRTGFTLIELLVVISIVALLMAILLPTLQRVGKQAKAVVCQSNQRQWGLFFSVQVADGGPLLSVSKGTPDLLAVFMHCDSFNMRGRDARLCPMATRLSTVVRELDASRKCGSGTTFTAWWSLTGDEPIHSGSYGINGRVKYIGRDWTTCGKAPWGAADAAAVASTPVLGDSAANFVWIDSPDDAPPPEEDLPFTPNGLYRPEGINRHSQTVNYLFLDWSVRKVGLKELWTLKWHKDFDTAGPWTRAGGVQPQDWPEWMRGFKDY